MKLTDKQKYQLLLEISQKIRDTLDLDEIISHLLDTVKTVVDYDAAGIFVLNQELVHLQGLPPTNKIAGVSWRGYNPPPVGKDDMLTHGKGICGYVITNATSLIVPDVRQDPRYIEGRKETISEIAVPILRNQRALGALNLESDQYNAYDKSDLEVLQFFADAAAIALEKAMLHRQLLQKELLDKQLQLARDVQMHLLPMGEPHLQNYDFASICIPAQEIGGDYYDYFHLPDGRLGIAVADVSGHGIASALAMTAFRCLLRMQTKGQGNLALSAKIVNHLLPELIGRSHFITMVFGILNPENGEIIFTSCGHPPPCLLHADGSHETLNVNGPAFGIYDEVEYHDEAKVLSPGDILAMYTDGVVEIENVDGQAFRVERLIQILKEHREQSAKELVDLVIKETHAFSGFTTYRDDFTLVIIKRY